MSHGVECAQAQWELMAEIERKGSTRTSIAMLYRTAIILGYNSGFDWPRVNAAILNRYSVSGLTYIKKRAWGTREFPPVTA